MRSHSIVLVTWSTNGRQNVIQKPGKRSDSEYRHVLCMTGVCWVAWWCHDCNWKYINPQIQDPNTCYSIFTGKSTGLFPQHLAWIKVSLRKGKHGTSLHDYLFFHIWWSSKTRRTSTLTTSGFRSQEHFFKILTPHERPTGTVSQSCQHGFGPNVVLLCVVRKEEHFKTSSKYHGLNLLLARLAFMKLVSKDDALAEVRNCLGSLNLVVLIKGNDSFSLVEWNSCSEILGGGNDWIFFKRTGGGCCPEAASLCHWSSGSGGVEDLLASQWSSSRDPEAPSTTERRARSGRRCCRSEAVCWEPSGHRYRDHEPHQRDTFHWFFS